ncbi:MAG: cell division protein ZapA [Motiliproteus sp.]|nr:cell division protein ZapA [Motiliproteus sp.]MCW9051363.1 cell division protein ZapA [Motiliproteus sp.]
MQSSDDNTVSIRVLDKEFLINCPEEAQGELLSSAKLLDQRMREIKGGGRVFGLERIAVMAALNLSHDLIQAHRELEELQAKTAQLSAKVDRALASKDSSE